MVTRICKLQGCGEIVGPPRGANAKYCTPAHQKKANVGIKKGRRAAKRAQVPPPLEDGAYRSKEESLDGRGSARRGAEYRKFVRSGLAARVASNEITVGEAAKEWGTSHSSVSRWMAAHVEDVAAGKAVQDWSADTSATVDFQSFSERYFSDLLIPDFHVEWSQLVNDTLNNGGRLLLLAPQRHGKSEMLIRYCLWRIITNPDISIIWVGKTASLAEKMVGYIRQLLEHHELLREDFLPPGDGFEPPNRSGLSWTNGEFTVSTRSKLRKSPTMAAIGVGGTILGRDADLVVVDDPIDRSMMKSPDQREKVAEWFFTDLLSRKEEATGLAYIGSRQHVDDLPARIMLREGWDVEVYRSHDPSCPHPEHVIDMHDECVLWPVMRSFKWLMEQKNQNPDHFERNYQNNPSADTFDKPSKDDLERAFDNREFGQKSPSTRILASVDPGSGVKKHAIVVWAYSEDGVREVVDISRPNAGTPAMAKAVRELYEKYRIVNWVFEKNRYEDQIRNDTELQDIRSKLGLNYQLHYTSGHNKHDAGAGVMAMLAEFRKQKCPINLPGGGAETRLRIAPLVRELLMYDPDFAKSSKHSQDDLVMAMWVGWFWMTKHVGNTGKSIKVSYPKGFGRNDHLGMGWNRPPAGWNAA